MCIRDSYDVGQYLRLKNIPVANIQWFEVAGDLKPEWGLIGHGDITETAVMMHINPDIVKVERAHIPDNQKIGNIQFEGDYREPTEGSDYIVEILLDDDMRDLYLQAWGGTNTIARALLSIEETYKDTDQWEEIQALSLIHISCRSSCPPTPTAPPP